MLETLRNRLVVSCQAYPGEPLNTTDAMVAMAEAAVSAGAAGIRAQGIEDIAQISARLTVPVIGLWKVGRHGVFITPTVEHALAVVAAGASIVAIDGTRRARPDGFSLAETVAAIKERTSALVMADVGSFDDGLGALDAGADIVATTLSGYTDQQQPAEGPDLVLVERLASRLSVPIFAEGRIRTPQQARSALDAGAYAVVVGTAITHPATITSWFVKAVEAPDRPGMSEEDRS